MSKITSDTKSENTEKTEKTGDTDKNEVTKKVPKSKKKQRRIRGQGSDKRHGIDRAAKYIEVKNSRRARNSIL